MNPFVVAIVKFVLPPIVWLVSLFIPGRRASVAYREARNKAWIMELVSDFDKVLASKGKDQPLEKLLELSYGLGDFSALWAVEGLGNYYAETFRNRNLPWKGLLTDPKLAGIPDKAMTMLHAGIGLAFGNEEGGSQKELYF